MSRSLLYAAACVLIPLAWGILVARLFDRFERWFERDRERREIEREERQQIEYYI